LVLTALVLTALVLVAAGQLLAESRKSFIVGEGASASRLA
jgi:hypothetical protein